MGVGEGGVGWYMYMYMYVTYQPARKLISNLLTHCRWEVDKYMYIIM